MTSRPAMKKDHVIRRSQNMPVGEERLRRLRLVVGGSMFTVNAPLVVTQ